METKCKHFFVFEVFCYKGEQRDGTTVGGNIFKRIILH